jgi:CopA family copper-resistance protein
VSFLGCRIPWASFARLAQLIINFRKPISQRLAIEYISTTTNAFTPIMRKIFLLTTMLLSLFYAVAQNTIYTCPMHPQIQSPGPGKCPICGMTLVKKTVKASPPKKTTPKPKPEPKAPQPAAPPAQHQHERPAPAAKDTVAKMDEMHMHPADSAVTHEGMPMEASPSTPVFTGPGKTVRYDLYVRDTMVNYSGKMKHAIAINGMIPAPELVFTESDTAQIYLHNELREESSLHWHGVILPNQADGVPWLTTSPVKPGDTHLYTFRVVQNGTYWYHSHSSLQEQEGMYGALVFKPAVVAPPQAMSMPMPSMNTGEEKSYTVVLSDWTDEHPMQVQRRLRTGNDWYSIQKKSTQSYSEAISAGYFKTKLLNEWKRMKAMDVSDVYYDKFLLNGRPESAAPVFKKGDRVRLRVVNAGASSYFWLNYGGGKISVVANDGNDMVPVPVDRLIIAPSETYDLVVTVPEDMSYEFRATSEDRTGYSSLWLGSGMKMPAMTLPRLNYFEGMKMMNGMMKTNGKMDDMGMKMQNQVMDMNSVMYPELQQTTSDTVATDTAAPGMAGMDMSSMSGGLVTLNYNMLRSPVKTILPDDKVRVLNFELTGNMNRYLWTLDNKTVTEADRILINKGEVLRLVLRNNSMMRHPMHLHGHDFRVLNKQGDYAPLKNVLDIMPMETDTVEFAANQNGNWFFHCHILYHMMAGMGRVFTYANSTVNPELPDAEKAYRQFLRHPDQNMRHLMVRAGIETNGSDGEAMLSGNRYALREMWHLGYQDMHGYESETTFGRYLGRNQWLFPYIGFDYHRKMEEGDPKMASDYKNMFGQVSNKNDRKAFVAGIEYTLPFLVVADARVDSDGKFRFQLSREDVPITPRLRFNVMGNTDREYMFGFRYITSKWLSLSTHYDSDMGAGIGLVFTY